MGFRARLNPCPSYRVSPHLENVPQGLKPSAAGGFTARLKSCPDTKAQSGDYPSFCVPPNLDLSIYCVPGTLLRTGHPGGVFRFAGSGKGTTRPAGLTLG